MLACKPSHVIGVLQPPYQRLRDVVKKLVTETRRSQRIKKSKKNTYDRHVGKFSTHAKCSEMIFRMTGMDTEADQVKPSPRRPGQRDAVVDPRDEPPGPADPGPAEPAPPDAGEAFAAEPAPDSGVTSETV